MSKNLKAFYFVITQKHTWGRGTSLKAAAKAAMISSLSAGGYVLYTGLCKNEVSDEQLANIVKCFNVTDWGGLIFYEEPRDKESYEYKVWEIDSKMLDDFFVGWVTNEEFVIDYDAKRAKATKKLKAKK